MLYYQFAVQDVLKEIPQRRTIEAVSLEIGVDILEETKGYKAPAAFRPGGSSGTSVDAILAKCGSVGE